MRVRQIEVTESDRKSARLFFAALLGFYEVGDALDMFARDGALTVSCYAGRVGQLDLWELGPEHADALARFRPRSVRIGCSYAGMEEAERAYDMVVVDTPQGLHRDHRGQVHAEHFDVVRGVGRLLNDRALLVLYVNRRPYDRAEAGSHGYDEYDEYDFRAWMEERQRFYAAPPREVPEATAIGAYARVLGSQGLRVRSTLVVPCYSDVPGLEPYAYRLALEVAR